MGSSNPQEPHLGTLAARAPALILVDGGYLRHGIAYRFDGNV